jgi:outer membrane protein OmpA-like peptidoglycan-associated protein
MAVWVSAILVTAALLPAGSCYSQVRSGLGFLKLTPSARQSGIAGSLAGALDYTESFYANPGAIGQMRQWQWSASYSNWISDLYYANFLFGRQFRTPWSRHSHFVLAADYLGIPEFDSSAGASLPVSGSDMLITAGFGQPVINDHVSVGLNLKYYRGELEQYQATAILGDVGILFRTARFEEDGVIFSVGISLANIGSSIKFDRDATPLPRIFRAGAAINVGSHDGMQMSLSSDFRKIRDQDGFFSFGTEVSWNQLLSLRMGYSFEHNLLGSFTFGAGIRLDNRILGSNSAVPGLNNALRMDIASNQGSDFSSASFHATANHIPVGPESFRLLEPAYNMQVDSDSIRFAWESSADKDLHDKVSYLLIADADSLKLTDIQEWSRSGGKTMFSNLAGENDFDLVVESDDIDFHTSDLQAGTYFWTVAAFDLDQHVRLGDGRDGKIGRFEVTAPEIQITEYTFVPSPLITEDSYQGQIQVGIRNVGQSPARNLSVVLTDAVPVLYTSKDGPTAEGDESHPEAFLDVIGPGATERLSLDWSTNTAGRHDIQCSVYQTASGSRNPDRLASTDAVFYTIPKGRFTTADTVLIQNVKSVSYELPNIGQVYFDHHSSEVAPQFVRQWRIEPVLVTLSSRLRERPDLKISLQGTADPNSGEQDIRLAEARASAVRDSMLSLGVAPGQITMLPGMVLPLRDRIPPDPEDAQRVFEERRRVDLIVSEADQKVLFGPLQRQFSEQTWLSMQFTADIAGAVAFTAATVRLKGAALQKSFDAGKYIAHRSIADDIFWQEQETDITDVSWQNTGIHYAIVITDSLNREFRTHALPVYLKANYLSRERRYTGFVKFGQVEPLYNFDWDNLLDQMPDILEDERSRLRFEGHACAIGTDQVNLDLSRRRAKLFHERFLAEARQRYPELYDDIRKRLDRPEGLGETQPLTVRDHTGEAILLGDNNLPTGRQLNRRVMALIYEYR